MLETINFEKNKEQLELYAKECREKIETLILTEKDMNDVVNIRRQLLKKGVILESASDEEVIRAQRQQLINNQINEITHIVERIMDVTEGMDLSLEFTQIVNTIALLHDIGRLEQATRKNNFQEAKGEEKHSQIGYRILFNDPKNLIEKFDVPAKLYHPFGLVILQHENPILPTKYPTRVENDFVRKPLDESFSLNFDETELSLVSVLHQLLKEIDGIKVLYQNVSGAMNLVFDDYGFDLRGETLEQVVAKFSKYGVTKEEIMEYNKLANEDISSLTKIRIPLEKDESLQMLEVPKDIQERFFKNELMDKDELTGRQDWNFITGMWWRLGTYVGNATFTSTLMLIKQRDILDTIYNKYPERFRFLVKPAFNFAKYQLLEKALHDNEEQIYVERGEKRV